MGLFHKKKGVSLFGTAISPSCSYCCHNGGTADQVFCALRRTPQGGACKKFCYDPLMREPHKAPSLSVDQYDKKDFQL